MAIQQADPATRRKAICIVIVALLLSLVGVASIVALESTLQAWLEQNIDFLIEHTEIVFFFFLILGSPVLIAAVFLFRYGHRIARSKRFPPPGYSVSRDTVIFEGARAVTRARIIQVLSLLLFFAASATPFFMWYIFKSLVS